MREMRDLHLHTGTRFKYIICNILCKVKTAHTIAGGEKNPGNINGALIIPRIERTEHFSY